MLLADLPTLALASSRVTRFVVHDNLVDRPRQALHEWLAKQPGGPKIIEGLSCTWCTGVWVSAALYAGWTLAHPARRRRKASEHVIAALAVAGAQGLLNSWEGE